MGVDKKKHAFAPGLPPRQRPPRTCSVDDGRGGEIIPSAWGGTVAMRCAHMSRARPLSALHRSIPRRTLCVGLMVEGLGGSGFRVPSVGFRVQGSGCREQG